MNGRGGFGDRAGPGTARVLTACALLVGLALMHSLGEAVGAGCAGGSTAITQVAAPAVSDAHDAAMTGATAAGVTMPMPTPHAAGHGTMCVSMPPPGAPNVSTPSEATGPTQPAGLEQPRRAVLRPGGALPRAGPALLISLCVSRT